MIEYHPVEEDTKEVLTNLLSENVDCIIMTSRGIVHYSQTVQHIRQSGMADLFLKKNILELDETNDFKVRGISDNEESAESSPRMRQIRYVDNIFFCAGNSKELILEEIIHRIHKNSKKKYKKIIFVDDSIQNVNKVHASFIKPSRSHLYRGIKTYAIHYAFMENFKRTYDKDCMELDNEKLRQMKQHKSWMNGRIEKNNLVAMNVFIGFSFLWWMAFKFLGIII